MGKYDDIINLPHYVSKKHPQMSMKNRAAQFAPFAALTGYGDAVIETARLVDKKIDIGEDAVAEITRKLNYIQDHIKETPLIQITYFVPDDRKKGGRYITESCIVKSIDNINRTILIKNGPSLHFDNLYEIKIL